MKDFVWRSRAKIVAAVDIVIIGLSSVLATYAVVYAGIRTYDEKLKAINFRGDNDVTKVDRSIPSTFYWAFGIVVSVFVLVLGLQLLAAVMLLKAGTIGQDPKTSMRRALFWRNVTIVFLILTIAGQITKRNIWGLVFCIVWRGVSLYVVRQFTVELDSFLKTPKNVEYVQQLTVIVQ